MSSKRDQHYLDGSQRVLQVWVTRDPAAAKTEAEASGRPSLRPIGTPSNAMAASMLSWTGSTKRARKWGPQPKQDGSTISASWGSRRWSRTNAPPKNPGGASRWRVLSTTPTLFSQRAAPSTLWLRTFCERPIGRGIRRISRPQCDRGKRGCASRVPLSSGGTARSTRGVLVEGATPRFLALVRHRRGLSGAYSDARLTLPSGGSLPPQ